MDLQKEMEALRTKATERLTPLGIDNTGVSVELKIGPVSTELMFWTAAWFKGKCCGKTGSTSSESLEKLFAEIVERRAAMALTENDAVKLANEVMTWWDDHNDGQVVPGFVRDAQAVLNKSKSA